MTIVLCIGFIDHCIDVALFNQRQPWWAAGILAWGTQRYQVTQVIHNLVRITLHTLCKTTLYVLHMTTPIWKAPNSATVVFYVIGTLQWTETSTLFKYWGWTDYVHYVKSYEAIRGCAASWAVGNGIKNSVQGLTHWLSGLRYKGIDIWSC